MKYELVSVDAAVRRGLAAVHSTIGGKHCRTDVLVPPSPGAWGEGVLKAIVSHPTKLMVSEGRVVGYVSGDHDGHNGHGVSADVSVRGSLLGFEGTAEVLARRLDRVAARVAP